MTANKDSPRGDKESADRIENEPQACKTMSRRLFLGAAAAMSALPMMGDGEASSVDSGTSKARYDREDNEFPVVFAQLRGDGPQSTTMEGEADVVVDGNEVTLTLTAEFDDPERLLDRDILSVELVGKDVPETEGENADQ